MNFLSKSIWTHQQKEESQLCQKSFMQVKSHRRSHRALKKSKQIERGKKRDRKKDQ